MAKITFISIVALSLNLIAFAEPEKSIVEYQPPQVPKLPKGLTDTSTENLIKIHPFFIDIYKKDGTNNRYTIELLEPEFQEGGRFEDFREILAEPRIAMALGELRKIAREQFIYLILNTHGLTEKTCSKKITRTENHLAHDAKVTIRAVDKRFWEIKFCEESTLAKLKLTFRLSNQSLPEPKKHFLISKDIKKCRTFFTRTHIGYYIKIDNEQYYVDLEKMSNAWQEELSNLWSRRDNTLVSLSEFFFYPLANGDVNPNLVFNIEGVSVEHKKSAKSPRTHEEIYNNMINPDQPTLPSSFTTEYYSEGMPITNPDELTKQRIYYVNAMMNGAFIPTPHTTPTTNTEL